MENPKRAILYTVVGFLVFVVLVAAGIGGCAGIKSSSVLLRATMLSG